MSANTTLRPELVELILAKLALPNRPDPTLAGLRALYCSWCEHVPFDNVRKLIHVRAENPGPLPGSSAEDYFNAWLKFGTGGTCWSGAGALHALLTSLGFDASRGIGTMLAAPNLPPNHGTVKVRFGPDDYLVDSAILCVEPLLIKPNGETVIEHPAWGVRAGWKNGHWYVSWRPLHKTDGFECRLERFDAQAAEYESMYEKTRGWSPFNYELVARLNRNGIVTGAAFGNAVTLQSNGSVTRRPISVAERNRILIEDLGLGEEIVAQLPPDVPTPPPPGSSTAQLR